MPDRSIAPVIVDAVDFNPKLQPCEKWTLKNGVEVYSVNAGAEELMSLELVFYAGNWFEQKNLVAATTNFLLKNGTRQRNAFQINEHFEYYGAHLSRACYNETSTLSLHTLTKHVRELLPVVRELVTDAQMPEEELSIYQQNMKQRLKVNLRKADFVAGRLIDVYLFGEEHPYGRYTKDEDFDTLNREELLQFYRQYYQQGRFIIFVAGKLPSDLEALLNEYFGDLPTQPVTLPTHALQPATEKKYRISNDPDGVQGSIRIAREFPNRHHPDFIRVQTLNSLFGGFFGSRLMSNIREDKGYTYGIHSYLLNHIHDSAWMISTEAGKEVCEATIAEVYKEMKELREVAVDDEELSLVKNFMIGSILGDLDGPFQIIGRWKNLILNGLDDQYFYKSIETIKSITPQELQELANRYLVEKDFYELVVV
ncbi:MAG: peptidase M16 [Sphingobacteriales bacterium SCN 48-20]|uniref:M16 family metallopeptidase n=1 Tax=Terrimonas ferruginea TaxID=249 RepID=UPI000869C2C8|nr:pitrilysin family protein [Terrimonas ferruginea]MBN8784683.1 insulinase family protein [Terrimonas ferruginea]ODT91305.1 MAG: peptidase M16 [Sphingobacteriales bacterium SCN 48-20]OJW45516.1 MAG: peptidase M16 [Sphingobacteriales bacterium 48-107]